MGEIGHGVPVIQVLDPAVKLGVWTFPIYIQLGLRLTGKTPNPCIRSTQHTLADETRWNMYRSPPFTCTALLPLGVLARLEGLEDRHRLLQGLDFAIHGRYDSSLVVAHLGIEVFPVGRGRHGGAEDGLDHEGVVGLEGAAVGLAEGVGQLHRRVVQVVTESLGREVEAAM